MQNDIRLCEIWIQYEDDTEFRDEVWLDIDGSIEDQIYDICNPSQSSPISNFKWDLVNK